MNTLDNLIALYPVQIVLDGGKPGSRIFAEDQADQLLVENEMKARALMARGYPSARNFWPEAEPAEMFTVRELIARGLKKWETPDTFKGEVTGYAGYWAFATCDHADVGLEGAENDV